MLTLQIAPLYTAPVSSVTIDEHVNNVLSTKAGTYPFFAYVDLTDVYNAFEVALGGDFDNLKTTDKTYRDAGLVALVDYLDNKMLGGTLPADYKSTLITELKNIGGYNSEIKRRARKIVVETIRAIATSPYYMIIK